MPDEKEKQQGKMVDIDTSGPGAEIDLPEEKVTAVEQEETNAETDNQDSNKSDDSSTKSDEQSNVEDSKQETEVQAQEEVVKEPEQKQEMDDYSEGVKKRIAKLTKKMREAERQRDEAVQYTQRIMKEKDDLSSKVSKLDTGYASEMENRIKSQIATIHHNMDI